MPLTVGGGIRALDDIRALLNAGADKVSINTAGIENPGLIDADILEASGRVLMRKNCALHGSIEDVLSTDPAFFLRMDMERWGRNPGASVTNAVDQLAPAAHRYLIGGFGIALADTQIVELDGSGAFDLVCGFGDGGGRSHRPLCGADRGARPRSREAFVAATGAMGHAMLQRAEAVGKGEWAGVEG